MLKFQPWQSTVVFIKNFQGDIRRENRPQTPHLVSYHAVDCVAALVYSGLKCGMSFK
jgi:hypothetical protein